MASSQDINTYIKEFPDFCTKVVVPDLQRFEQERLAKKSIVDIFNIVLTISLVGFVGDILFCFFAKPSGIFVFIVAAFLLVSVFICVFFRDKTAKNFERRVKSDVLNKFLSFFGDFSWSKEPQISQDEIKQSLLFPEYTAFKNKFFKFGFDFSNEHTRGFKLRTDDNFYGIFKGQKIVISEIQLDKTVERKTIGKNESTIDNITVFRGALVKISLNKKFSTQTVIVNDSNIAEALPIDSKVVKSVIGALCAVNNLESEFHPKQFYKKIGLQPVELEDPEFNKMFDVYAEDQIESRYMITTAFIERFKLVLKAFNTNFVSASFIDNNLILAIPSMALDMFVLGSVKVPVDDMKQINTFFKEIISILALVDILKLDQKIGL